MEVTTQNDCTRLEPELPFDHSPAPLEKRAWEKGHIVHGEVVADCSPRGLQTSWPHERGALPVSHGDYFLLL